MVSEGAKRSVHIPRYLITPRGGSRRSKPKGTANTEYGDTVRWTRETANELATRRRSVNCPGEIRCKLDRVRNVSVSTPKISHFPQKQQKEINGLSRWPRPPHLMSSGEPDDQREHGDIERHPDQVPDASATEYTDPRILVRYGRRRKQTCETRWI